MKYILTNPTFTKESIIIDNPEAVTQINYFMNKQQKKNNIIDLYLNNTIIKLKILNVDKDICLFENIKRIGR